MNNVKSYVSLQRAGHFWIVLAFNFALLFILFANTQGGTTTATVCIACMLFCKCIAQDLLIWADEVYYGEDY